MYIILNLLPICLRIISITISYLLMGKISTSLQGVINYIMIVNNFLVFPLYFIILIGSYTIKRNKSVLLSFAISVVICVVVSAIRYLYWGMQYGNIFNPDDVTIIITKGTVFAPIILLSLGYFILTLIKIRKNKKALYNKK